MDVRCERCQTEYEVEDASVSDLGTDVQCSDCGHLFTVKRSQAAASPVLLASLPVSSEGKVGGAWTLLTTLGQRQDLRDLTQLHKLIIERRVAREDKISEDGQAWQALGTMAELVPFFDIVDSAERARVLEAAPPVMALAPLQPPILTQHDVRVPGEGPRIGRTTPKLGSPHVTAHGSGDSLGALPQATDIGETEMIQAQSSGSRRLVKLVLMVAVAAGIAGAGILWQKHYLRPAVISSSGGTEEQVMEGKVAATVQPPSIPAPAVDEGPETDDEPSHKPIVEPLDNSEAAQTPAAQGYAALNRRQYVQAIVLFKRALAQSPSNGTALFGLAEAHRAAGNKQLALQTYRRYVDIFPFGPDVGSARFQVRKLESKKR